MSKINWNDVLSEENATKVKDLEAVIQFNKEAMEAYRESVDVHKKGLEVLSAIEDEGLSKISEQFQNIINNHEKAYENLHKYNMDAENFLSFLETEKDKNTILVLESLMKLVAFK